jgi:non-ribosomal peptide synthetase-like protein
LGNGAIVPGGTEFGPGTLVGVQSSAPPICPPHTSWFGAPALEFPRVPQRGDPRRTVAPSGRLILGRAVNELCRIVLPTSVSAAIALGVFGALVASGQHLGAWAVAVFATPALLAGGAVAVSATVVAKWVLMGRYRAGDHPLWSWFVWRDEILNTCQEVIAGIWLLDVAQGTALMNLYLRLMGTRVGRDVWCDTMNITEFDVVTLGDGCAVNRNACVETHLFHDRIMSIGPTRIGARATLGPSSVVLPETTLGEGSCVGGRSVVLRGEALPERSRWHGAPVVAM